MPRSIIDHEIVMDSLILTLDDGTQHIARDFVGVPSAEEAWEDIDQSGYTFEAACSEYTFEPLDN